MHFPQRCKKSRWQQQNRDSIVCRSVASALQPGDAKTRVGVHFRAHVSSRQTGKLRADLCFGQDRTPASLMSPLVLAGHVAGTLWSSLGGGLQGTQRRAVPVHDLVVVEQDPRGPIFPAVVVSERRISLSRPHGIAGHADAECLDRGVVSTGAGARGGLPGGCRRCRCRHWILRGFDVPQQPRRDGNAEQKQEPTRAPWWCLGDRCARGGSAGTGSRRTHLRGTGEPPVLVVERHCRTVQGRELLQPFGGNGVGVAIGPAVGMQHRHPAPVGALELDQPAVGVQSQDLVQIEKVGFASHVVPLATRWRCDDAVRAVDVAGRIIASMPRWCGLPGLLPAW